MQDPTQKNGAGNQKTSGKAEVEAKHESSQLSEMTSLPIDNVSLKNFIDSSLMQLRELANTAWGLEDFFITPVCTLPDQRTVKSIRIDSALQNTQQLAEIFRHLHVSLFCQEQAVKTQSDTFLATALKDSEKRGCLRFIYTKKPATGDKSAKLVEKREEKRVEIIKGAAIKKLFDFCKSVDADKRLAVNKYLWRQYQFYQNNMQVNAAAFKNHSSALERFSKTIPGDNKLWLWFKNNGSCLTRNHNYSFLAFCLLHQAQSSENITKAIACSFVGRTIPDEVASIVKEFLRQPLPAAMVESLKGLGPVRDIIFQDQALPLPNAASNVTTTSSSSSSSNTYAATAERMSRVTIPRKQSDAIMSVPLTGTSVPLAGGVLTVVDSSIPQPADMKITGYFLSDGEPNAPVRIKQEPDNRTEEEKAADKRRAKTEADSVNTDTSASNALLALTRTGQSVVGAGSRPTSSAYFSEKSEEESEETNQKESTRKRKGKTKESEKKESGKKSKGDSAKDGPKKPKNDGDKGGSKKRKDGGRRGPKPGGS